jgi:hypothetical protein
MSLNNKWPIEGKEHSKIKTKDIFTNSAISNFLNNDNIELLIASKGMGKTLLLRAKKNILEEKNKKESRGYLIIPKDKEFDEPKFSGHISSNKIVQDMESWRNLWEICIILSILSYSGAHRENSFFSEIIQEFFQSIGDKNSILKLDFRNSILLQKSLNPSYYLNEICSKLGYSEIEQFTKLASKIYNVSEKLITSQVCIFIDAFDQTLSDHFKDNIELWKNAQLGLMKAIHKLHIENKHIKGYSSIRQEAFAGFRDPDRAVIKGKSLILEYSKKDLKNLLDFSINLYCKKNGLVELLGFKEINNSFVLTQENVFDYIYRHSIYTPRSICLLGKEIDDLTEKSVQNFKRKINEKGADNLMNEYLFSEKLMLLSNLSTETSLETFLNLVPSNIINYSTLIAINKRYSKTLKLEEGNVHPFCELVNIGVIGQVIAHPTEHNEFIQKFIKPHEYVWRSHNLISNDKTSIYLIHPSLYDRIHKIKSKSYRINRKCIVGDDLEILPQNLFPKIFISHSSLDNSLLEENFLSSFEESLSLLTPFELWIDTQKLIAGDNFHAEISKGLKNCQIAIVFISKNSINSKYVEQEWRTIQNLEISAKPFKLIPIIIDDIHFDDLPNGLEIKAAIKFDGNWVKLINKLSNDIFENLLNLEII